MSETVNARILGIGHYVPEHVVTNDDLDARRWTRATSGSSSGPASASATSSRRTPVRPTWRVHAAREALARPAVAPADLDLILLGTLSPDIDFPASASLLQRHLGVRGMPAMDVRNQCSGFLYMLAMADAFIRTGGARHVLVVGAEMHSTGLDLSTAGREVAVIFGDGAGAVVLGPEPDPRARHPLDASPQRGASSPRSSWWRCPPSRVRPRVTPGDADRARAAGSGRAWRGATSSSTPSPASPR